MGENGPKMAKKWDFYSFTSFGPSFYFGALVFFATLPLFGFQPVSHSIPGGLTRNSWICYQNNREALVQYGWGVEFERFRFSVPAVPLQKGFLCGSVQFNRKGQFRFLFLENGSGGSGSAFGFGEKRFRRVLDLLFLASLEKKKTRKTTKKQGISVSSEPITSLEKKGKHSRKQGISR